MILSPISNTAILLTGGYGQKRPVITQEFGERPEVYKKFGLKGHNGLDMRAKTGTNLYSPMEGTARVFNEGSSGYGKYIKITKPNLEVTLAHLSEVLVKDGQRVYLGDLIGYTGNTGFSTAPHLHITVKMLYDNGKVMNYDNGYKGAVDPAPLLLTWKGSLTKTDL